MTINEDFFDSEEFDDEQIVVDNTAEEKFKKYRYVAAIHYFDNIKNFDIDYLNNTMDKCIINVDYSELKYDCTYDEHNDYYITFKFNHSFKNINDSMQFLNIIYNGLKRPVSKQCFFEIVDNEPISDDAVEQQLSLLTYGKRMFSPYEMNLTDDNKLIKKLYFINVILLGPSVSYFDIRDYLSIPHNMDDVQINAFYALSKNYKIGGEYVSECEGCSIWSSIEKLEQIQTEFLNATTMEIVEYNNQENTMKSVMVDGNDLKHALLMFKYYGRKIIINKYFIITYPWTYVFTENGKKIIYIQIGQFKTPKDYYLLYYAKIQMDENTDIGSFMNYLKINKYE